MLSNYLQILRSPCCYSTLKINPVKEINNCLFSGELLCEKCNERFPIERGVIYLSLLNSGWDIILQEFISRRNITQRGIESQTESSEYLEIEQKLDEQNKIASDIMNVLFEEALKLIKPTKEMSILDVGAGEGKTTIEFARHSDNVIAVDTEPSGLSFINFSVFNLPAPISKNINNKIYYEYSPNPLSTFFHRFICPAECLPFASNSFDIVFCRATLHHLSNLNSAIYEMIRVCKKGGRIVFCAEPMRSILDSEDFYLEGTVDREEGLNERYPHILNYFIPFLKERMKVSVQYWRRPLAPLTQKFINFMPFNWDKHFYDGELAKKRKLLKLIFTSASVNIYAIKKRLSADRKPSYWNVNKIDSIDKIAEIYGKRTLDESSQKFSDDTSGLMCLRRKILSLKNFSQTFLIPYKMKSYQLWQGWGKIFEIGGKKCRKIHPMALCTLKKPYRAKFLNVEYFFQGDLEVVSLLIKINSLDIGKFNLAQNKWEVLKIEIDKINEGLIDVILRLVKIGDAKSLKLQNIKNPLDLTQIKDNILFIHRIFFSK